MGERMAASEIIRLLDILIGTTTAYGSTEMDDIIFENLQALEEITEWCLDGIQLAAKDWNRPEASMRRIGTEAKNELIYEKDWITRTLDELKEEEQ